MGEGMGLSGLVGWLVGSLVGRLVMWHWGPKRPRQRALISIAGL